MTEFGSAAAGTKGPASGFRLRLTTGQTVALPDGKQVTGDDIPGYDIVSPMAEVVRHPEDPAVLGLKNLKARAWTATRSSGEIVQIEPGQAITLVAGTRINFGRFEGEVLHGGSVAPQQRRRSLVPALLVLLLVVAGAGACLVLRPGAPGDRGTAPEKQPVTDLAPLDPAKIVSDPRLHTPRVKDQILVTLHPKVSEPAFQKILGGLDAQVRIVGRIPSIHVLQLEAPADKLYALRQRLANHPYVARAGFNFVYYATQAFNDPAASRGNESWGISRIRVPEAWEITRGGALIAIVDSAARSITTPAGAGKIFAPFSFATGSGAMQDFFYHDARGHKQFTTGHGTHVAITAAGSNRHGIVGVAPASPVMPIQALLYDARAKAPMGSSATIAGGIAGAIDAGAQVINLSLGGSYSREFQLAYLNAGPDQQRDMEQYVSNELEEELQSYNSVLDLAQARRVILVKAAGNDGLPAGFDALCYSRRVISVAATNQDNGWANWSRDGTSASRHGGYVTVSAPGTGIWSGYPDPDQPYKALNGTSMATPHVAGVVALMKSLKADLTFEEVRDILQSTGRRLRTEKPIGPLVDARAAVDEVIRRKSGPVAPPPAEPPLTPEPPAEPPPAGPDDDAILDGPAPWNNEKVRFLIDVWLATAQPPPGNPDNPSSYDRWGQVVNAATPFTVKPAAAGRASHYEYLWRTQRALPSANQGTLEEFVRTHLEGGLFDPAPPPMTPPVPTPPRPPKRPKVNPGERLKLTNAWKRLPPGAPNPYLWAAYLEGPAERLKEVQSVRYVLHPSFRDERTGLGDVVDVDNNAEEGFPLERAGWGRFKLKAVVRFKDGSTESLTHDLILPDGR